VDWQITMIIQNAVRIVDGDKESFVISTHRHDFRSHEYEAGKSVSVDGGNEYFRRAGNFEDRGTKWFDWNIDDNTPFKTIKERLLWGTRGKSGTEPLKYVRLVKCETDHLQSILTYPYPKDKPLNPLYKMVIQDILDDRGVI
jgi:hypothetical protein